MWHSPNELHTMVHGHVVRIVTWQPPAESQRDPITRQLKTRWTAQCPGNFQHYRGYKAATLFHFISLQFPGIWYAIQHYNRQIRKSMYKRTCSDNNAIIRAVSKILSGRNYKHISYINFSNASTRNFGYNGRHKTLGQSCSWSYDSLIYNYTCN